MERRETENYFVIFHNPERGRDTHHYYDDSGHVTAEKLKAARFDKYEDAKAFVVKNDILLGIITYIGKETFSENEFLQYVEYS